MGKIIAVTNQKGGVGKTTTAINLSACIAAAGKRVLVVDIDPQGNTTSGLGIDKSEVEDSVYDMLVDGVPFEDVVMETRQATLRILPSNIQLAGAEVEMVGMMAREQLLKRCLDAVRDQFDFIFIDCPPSLGLLTLNALTAADKVLVPIQCEYFALEGLSQLMNTVNLVRRNLNSRLEMEGVVLTMLDARTNLSMQVVEEVRRYFKEKVYKTTIPRNIKLGEAPSYGLPINLYDPKCTGALAYAALADEVIAANKEALQ